VDGDDEARMQQPEDKSAKDLLVSQVVQVLGRVS
jgi:hypothetical protein